MSKAIAITSELPPSWATFADRVASGCEPEAVAKELGYAAPATTATLLMQNVKVRKALVASVQARLEGEAGPLALKAILDVLSDEKAPGAVKAKLALGVFDRIQPAKDDRPLADKPLADLTTRELETLVDQMRGNSPPAPQMRDITPK